MLSYVFINADRLIMPFLKTLSLISALLAAYYNTKSLTTLLSKFQGFSPFLECNFSLLAK